MVVRFPVAPEVERIYAWRTREQVLYAKFVGIAECLPVFTIPEEEKVVVVCLDRVVADMMVQLLTYTIDTKPELETGIWVIAEEEKPKPVYAVISRSLYQLKILKEFEAEAMKSVTLHPLFFLTGVLIGSGVFNDVLEFYTTEEFVPVIDTVLDTRDIKYEKATDVVEFPAELSYPPVELMDIEEVSYTFYSLSRDEGDTLLLLLNMTRDMLHGWVIP